MRAAVLGSNDGLVSNLGLVMGVAGFSQSNDPTLVAGLAGIIAGACSMAMGEWVSVKSSIEVYEKDLANLRGEFERHPEKKRLELVRNFSARGFTHEAAKFFGRHLRGDAAKEPEPAVTVFFREFTAPASFRL